MNYYHNRITKKGDNKVLYFLGKKKRGEGRENLYKNKPFSRGDRDCHKNEVGKKNPVHSL